MSGRLLRVGLLLMLWLMPTTAAGQTPAPEPPKAEPEKPAKPEKKAEPEKRAEPDEGDDLQDIEDIDLEDLLNQKVTTATKTETTAEKTPAVVTVITAKEIRARGLRNLAQVLSSVPGFYNVYDLHSHNFGVRGINGGPRARGNVIKVMIDGQPVAFRSNLANFFGDELIPIEAVERVEVIRGPASALYGANAFLGVINIITTDRVTATEGDGAGAVVTGRVGAMLDRVRGGASMVVGGKSGPVSVLVGVNLMAFDNGGLTLPSTSPGLVDGSLSRSVMGDNVLSPLSLLARFTVGTPDSGQWSLLASIQRDKGSSELSDYYPLTSDRAEPTVLASFNQNYRLSVLWAPLEGLTLRGSIGIGLSGPDEDEQINLGRDDEVFIRHVNVVGSEGSFEAAYRFEDRFQLTVGFDLSIEDHELQHFDTKILEDVFDASGTLLRPAGTIIPGADADRPNRELTNYAGYLQFLADITPEVSATVGVRIDYQNIYDLRFSSRAAVVWTPSDDITLKLLYGSSFRAPSAEQLFTTPATTFDIRGNADLNAQTAHTGEIAASVRLGRYGVLLANVFVTGVLDKVSYKQEGLYLEAQNREEEIIVGAEVDARLTLVDWLDWRIGLGVARSVARSSDGLEIVPVDQALFPTFQLHTQLQFKLPHGIAIVPEVSVVSPRASSQSNSLEAGAQYDLPWRVVTALAVTADLTLWDERRTYIALRAENLVNQTDGDPGFKGIDYPLEAFNVLLTLSQQF